MKKLFLILAILCTLIGYSQQEQQYSQYMINPFVLNPAVAGTEDFIDASLGFRSQWTGFDGSPVTYYFAAHGAVGKEFSQYHHKGEHKYWHGVGTQVYRDHTGPLRRTSFLLAYAYNMPIDLETRLSIGAFFWRKAVGNEPGLLGKHR